MGGFLNTHLPFLACAGLCWSVWRLFKYVDKEKSLFKKSFTTRLINLILAPSSIFSVLSNLPNFFVTAFDLIFTENLFSWRGFLRSCKISLVLVLLLGILWYATIPEYVYLEIRTMPFGSSCYMLKIPPFWNYGLVSMIQENGYVDVHVNYLLPTFFTPLLYNFVFDYAALLFIRNLLRYLSTIQARSILLVPLVFVSSLSMLVVIAFVGFKIASTLSWYLTGCREQFFNEPSYIEFMVQILSFPFYKQFPEIFGRWYVETILGVFVYSTLFGMVWIILLSVGLILANLSMRI